MKKMGRGTIEVQTLEWEYFDKCCVCNLPLEVAETGPESVSLRHVGTRLPWEVCRRQRRAVGQRGEEKEKAR